MQFDRKAKLIECVVESFTSQRERVISGFISAVFGRIDCQWRTQCIKLEHDRVIAVDPEHEGIEWAFVEYHPADVTEYFRHLVHCALMCGKPDVGFDLLLLLKGAVVVERTFDCVLSSPSFTEIVGIDHLVLEQRHIFVTLTHFQKFTGVLRIGCQRVVGVPPTPHCGTVIAVRVLMLQYLDLLGAELVPWHQDDDRLVGMLGYVLHGSGSHQGRFSAAGRGHQQ
jgi:hypothetical protein